MTGVKIMIRTKGWTRRHGPTPAGASRRATSASTIHHPLSIINPTGFTLIELLIVISVIAALLAILLPTLQGVRKQAQAAACQANLRQWGLYYSMHCMENNGKMPPLLSRSGWYIYLPSVLPGDFFDVLCAKGDDLGCYDATMREFKELLLCPATRWQPLESEPCLTACMNGTTRLAWSYGAYTKISNVLGSSYAQNAWIPPTRAWAVTGAIPAFWTSSLVKGASGVPVYSDCRAGDALPCDADTPPSCEDAPLGSAWGLPRYAMNRHGGGINTLFLDWSVRKVGIKELWTLKWHEEFDPAGEWTKAGGVQPEDWPQWMRRFKDY